MKIIDSHFHLGNHPDFIFFDTSIATCLSTMDRLGIKYCINTHSIFTRLTDFKGGVEKSRSAFEESSGRLLSYILYDPRQSETALHIIKHNYDNKIFKGIKIHPSRHLLYGSDDAYEPVWEYAGANNIPILSHTWEISSYNPVQKYSFPTHFEKFIRKFPQVRFMCGHAGGRYSGICACVELMKRYPNVFADISGYVYNNKLVEYLVKEVGSTRILYGSDGFWIDWRTQLGMVLGANITFSDKENIFYKNAQEIFGLS